MHRTLLTLCIAALLPVLTITKAGAAETKFPYLSLKDARAKYADPAGHIAKIDGVEVYYKDEGKGPVILMIHGSSSSLKTYDLIAAKLIDRYRVIRFDIPPLGLSGPVSDEDIKRLEPTDIPQKLLAQLAVKDTACVGVSSGGTNCIYLAAKNPGLVNHLILSNSPSDPVEGARPTRTIKLDAETKKASDAGFKTRAYWDAFFEVNSGDPSRITPAIREQYYDFNRRPPDKNLLFLSAKVFEHEKALALMDKVTVPTLLVWGEQDPLLPHAAADVLAKYLAHAQISKLFLPDVGHYPPLEVPERYAQIIAAYLEAVTPGPNKAP